MSSGLIHGLLWHARASMRIDRVPMAGGHGSADPNYRPGRLPYVSVVGPLSLELEPDRDPPRGVFVFVQSPGYLTGRDGMDTAAVPGGGTLYLRFDGDTRGDVAVDFAALGGATLTDTNSRAAAVVVEAAIRGAVDAGLFLVNGTQVTDVSRLAELRRVAVRWDRNRKRFVITSGRRGTRADPAGAVPPRPSRVETEAGANDLAPALGLREGSIIADGRLSRQKLTTPTAVAVDVRVDLWAGSQQELSLLLETWARTTPTRTQVLTRPGLLTESAAENATQITLQRQGDVPTRWSLVQLEPDGDFRDRLSADQLALTNGATVDARTLRFTGQATATMTFFTAPPIALPGLPEHPAPAGFGLAIGLRADAPIAAGQAARVLRITRGTLAMVELDLAIVAVDGELFAELTASAQRADGAPYSPIAARLPAAQVTAGTDLHIVLDASGGALSLYADGVPLVPLVAAAAQPGATPAGGYDMQLVLGDPAGAALTLRILHLHLIGRPLGPIDPRFRGSLAAARSWSIGDPIALVRTENGFSGAGDAEIVTVIGVDGDSLLLDRPLVRTWPRASTLVYSRSLFAHQRQWRRHDDIMNNLYRLSVEYRVSSFLEDPLPAVSAPLVERPEVEVFDLTRRRAERDAAGTERRPDYPSAPAAGTPAVRALIRNADNSSEP